jgi:hypothetical protein
MVRKIIGILKKCGIFHIVHPHPTSSVQVEELNLPSPGGRD